MDETAAQDGTSQADKCVRSFRTHAKEFLDVTKNACEDMFRSYEHKFNDLQRDHAAIIQQATAKTVEANAKLVELFTNDFDRLKTSLREDFAEFSVHNQNQFETVKTKFVEVLKTTFKDYSNQLAKLTDDATKQLDAFFNNHSKNFEKDFESFMENLHGSFDKTVKRLRQVGVQEQSPSSPSK